MDDQASKARADAVASEVAKLADPDADVRREAAVALATRPGGQAVPALRKAVEDEDVAVRTVALVTLGQLFDDGSVGIMSQALLHDPEVNVRRAALSALSRLRTESARRAVEAAQSDADAGVRQAAEEARRNWKNRPGAN
jgi:HEAT repeat protein